MKKFVIAAAANSIRARTHARVMLREFWLACSLPTAPGDSVPLRDHGCEQIAMAAHGGDLAVA
jgi:hypothetical protein